MAVLSRLRDTFRRPPTDDAGSSAVISTAEEHKKDPATDGAAVVNSSDESRPELPSENLQRGVQHVEAVTLAWSKASLIAVFLKYLPSLPKAPYTDLRANVVSHQYMVSVLRQCIPVLNSLELGPVRYERF